jgi:hypothetical protein
MDSVENGFAFEYANLFPVLALPLLLLFAAVL